MMTPTQKRRAALITHMHQKGGGVAIIAAAPELIRNNDVTYPYRQDSYFYYLTGFTEPEALLVLLALPNKKSHIILFCRNKDPLRETWDGYRYGPDAARDFVGVNEAFAIDAVDTHMIDLIANAPALFYTSAHNKNVDEKISIWFSTIRSKSRQGYTVPVATYDLHSILDEMRLFKDKHEIISMRRAAQISAAAHARAMRYTKPGLHEYQIDAELLHEFRHQGAQAVAYESIVATGANACVLHYRAGNTQLKDGDLVLIDAGCELDNYASDITRTFPVNGKFSAAQKTLYEIVLAAQTAAINESRAGKNFMDPHHAAVRVLAQGMLDCKLLNKRVAGNVDDVINDGTYKQFYMHLTGHWLGSDVHDVGRYHTNAATDNQGKRQWRTLEVGMVTTVEPGIYVRPDKNVPEKFWNIGIRIEDDVLITAKGCEVLSKDAPKSVADIESIMRK